MKLVQLLTLAASSMAPDLEMVVRKHTAEFIRESDYSCTNVSALENMGKVEIGSFWRVTCDGQFRYKLVLTPMDKLLLWVDNGR